MAALFQRTSRRIVVTLSRRRTWLCCEELETRVVPAGSSIFDLITSDFHAVMVAGALNGSPADSPAQRVDANLNSSAFAGVGSLEVRARQGQFTYAYWGSATAIGPQHILTAAHMFDINNDGNLNAKDGILSVTFRLNLDPNGGATAIPASTLQIHPDYTGFARPSVNDDIAVAKLSTALPAEVPYYSLDTAGLSAHQSKLFMVGYGRSGDGVNGYTVGASLTVKRTGQNIVDAFYGQDDRRKPAANEVFRFDFDGPTGNGSLGGGSTLGNAIETQLGPGDSGGPSFVLKTGADPALAASYVLAGVNTFTQGSAPFFGSLGGGMVVASYRTFIDTATGGATLQAASASAESEPSGTTGKPTTEDGKNVPPADEARRLVSFLTLNSAFSRQFIVANPQGIPVVQGATPAPVFVAPPNDPMAFRRIYGSIGQYVTGKDSPLPDGTPDAAAPAAGGSQPQENRPAPSLYKLNSPWHAVDTVFAAEPECGSVAEIVACTEPTEPVDSAEADPIGFVHLSGIALMILGGMACPVRGMEKDRLDLDERFQTLSRC